jgi:hypothetical protein
MKLFKNLLILFLSVGVISCDMTDLELQDNPNAVTPENASINDLYNNIQLSFRNVYSSAQGTPGALSRMYHLGSYLYQTSTSPNTLNGLWSNAYSTLFPDIDALLNLAEARGLDIHAGSAKIMKAYTLLTLVDLLGDVPNSEAGQGTDIISPSADAGSQVYSAAIGLLDEAIAQLNGTSAAKPPVDIYYGGSTSGWIKAANSIKLKAALNLGDAGAINSVVSGGNLISSNSDNFEFTYGSQRANPNSRHPFYQSHYEVGDGDYMSNYYMWLLRADKDVIDPRIRFYFYRKVDDAVNQDPTTYGCHFSVYPDQSLKPEHFTAVDPDLPYCVASADGYSGRDHLNGEGIPPDGPIRTSYGLYPGGGQFDDDSFTDTRKSGTTGALGNGIWPIMHASFVDFMRAEAALTLGTNDDAKSLLESGIRKSVDKVHSFKSKVAGTMSTQVTLRDGSSGTIEELYVPGQDKIDAYVQYVLDAYDAADANGKLDIVVKEYYIAAFGNGLEAYNMYRRTGKPGNMQPGLEPGVGSFVRSLFLPAVHVDRNANATQKTVTDRVFWDNGPEVY